MDGWIKLHRKVIDSQVFASSGLFKLWCLCLMKANHVENWVDIEGLTEPIKVMPGQFITGRFELHKNYYPRKKKNNKSPSTLWNWLQKLENMENLNINSYTKYSIITILNWNEYQLSSQQPNNNLTTTSQQPNTDNNDKNVKNEKKELELPDFINPETWKAFKDHRKKMRLIMTPHAEKLIINKLIKFHEDGVDPNAELDRAIERGWRSVFLPKDEVLSEADQIRNM